MKNETAAPGALADSCCSWKCHLTHLCNVTLRRWCRVIDWFFSLAFLLHRFRWNKKNVSIIFNFCVLFPFTSSAGVLLILSQEHMLHMQALDQRAQETNLEHWLNPHCYPRCDRNYGYPVWRREHITALHPYCLGLNISECLPKFTHIPASKSESSSSPTTASLAVIRYILTHPLPRRSCCAAVASLPPLPICCGFFCAAGNLKNLSNCFTAELRWCYCFS